MSEFRISVLALALSATPSAPPMPPDAGLVSEFRISLLALVVSVAVALWQLVHYVLEGGRVRVRMLAGLLDDYRLQNANTWRGLAKVAAERGGWHVEVAVIEVENLGRTAVTVSGAALDLGPLKWWRPWQRWSIAPHALAGHEAVTTWKHRLEPFDSVRFMYEVWPTLAPSMGDGPPRPLRLRGTVRVAGKRWPRRSAWRRGWPVLPGQVTFLPKPLEVGMAAYRALWRHVSEGERGVCIPVALAVRKQFPLDGPPPTQEQLKDLLRAEWLPEPPPAVSLLSLYMANDLRPLYEQQSQT